MDNKTSKKSPKRFHGRTTKKLHNKTPKKSDNKMDFVIDLEMEFEPNFNNINSSEIPAGPVHARNPSSRICYVPEDESVIRPGPIMRFTGGDTYFAQRLS